MRIFACLLGLAVVSADVADHRYKTGEHVELWVNKVCWSTAGSSVIF